MGLRCLVEFLDASSPILLNISHRYETMYKRGIECRPRGFLITKHLLPMKKSTTIGPKLLTKWCKCPFNSLLEDNMIKKNTGLVKWNHNTVLQNDMDHNVIESIIYWCKIIWHEIQGSHKMLQAATKTLKMTTKWGLMEK